MTDWVYIADTDEFLFLKDGLKTLDDFFDKVGYADIVPFASFSFGSNGLKMQTAERVTSRFTQTMLKMPNVKPTELTAVKALFHNSVKGSPRSRPHRPITNNFVSIGKTCSVKEKV